MKQWEAEKVLIQALHTIYPDGEAVVMADMVMEALTGADKMHRRMQKTTLLTAGQQQLLGQWQQQLLNHEPVQYVLHKAWFYGMPLYVDDSVLIPRPETEELVQWIADDVRHSNAAVFAKNAAAADCTDELKILDIGTGSGCIPLALKKAIPLAEVWGCDVSEAALNVARRNASELNIRVDFQCADILDEGQQRLLPSVDIIVSNPPYIPVKDKESMRANVLEYEPHLALFVPDDDALLFYRAIARFGHRRLHRGGTIYLETHEALAQDVARLFQMEGYTGLIVKKDMQGKERMVKAAPPLR